MKEKIVLLSGDPNSINSELIYKSWKKIPPILRKQIYVISNFNLLKRQFHKLKYQIDILKVKDLTDTKVNTKLKIINVDLSFTKPFKIGGVAASKYVLECLKLGHNLGLDPKVKGIINCPINKNLLGKKKIGVTEYFASKNKLNDSSVAMLIKSKSLAVCPLTTHIDVKQISKKIKFNTIINKIKIINFWYKKNLKKKPKIAILGLNPHNAEFRRNSEEKKIIEPSIKKLKKLGISVFGPFPADSFFINEYNNYDVVVGMFHDQILTPFKTLFKFDAINISLGLKYLRTSPDHGTAKNLIGRNKANPTSLLNCINFINKFGK